MPSTTTPVTVAITRRVATEDQALMRAWVEAGTRLAERYDGFLGAGWVRPAASSEEWHMLYRFDSSEHLAGWESSHERARWLGSASALVQDTRVEHRTGIEGWFDEPAEHRVIEPTTPSAPPRWKQAIVIWCAFFPTSLALTYLLMGLTHDWWPAARVLLSTLLAVPWMTYFFLPQVTRVFQPWLNRTHPPAPR